MSRTREIRKSLLPFLEDHRITSSLIAKMAGDELLNDDEEQLISELEKELGDAIYVHIMFQLTHEMFPEGEAKKFWEEILEHKFNMSCSLDRNVGVVVAAMDYLCNLRHRISGPSIISGEGMATIVEVAIRDGLTGLYEKFTFLQKLHGEVKRCQRHDLVCSLLMLDLDHFKEYNDTRGHVQGDQLLSEVGKIIVSCIRETDIAGRYGGEEFSVLLPFASLEEGLSIGERIRDSIERDAGVGVTISVGCANFPNHADDSILLLKRADEALYLSKKSGRNRVSALDFAS